MRLSRALYRLRQFLSLALPLPGREGQGEIADLLTPAQRELFVSMSRFGQRHCLKVCNALLASGCTDRDMLVAALLHDAGKEGAGATHRAVCVLLRAFAPQILQRWASERPGTWRHGLYINLHHAERGAALAKAASASPETVELILRHQSRPAHDPRLLALQQADEVN